MVLSYRSEGGCPEQPPFCCCENPHRSHFHKRGRYKRVMTEVICYFFSCCNCGTHITMLADYCVPFKQYPADVINGQLDELIEGRSAYQVAKEDLPDMHERTIGRWLAEWRGHCGLLASMGTDLLSTLVTETNLKGHPFYGEMLLRQI